jgi:L-malate glycosyltransferase
VPILNRPLRVMHIISGDLWAGAEVQAYTLLKHLYHEVDLCVILMNQGELSEKLAAVGIKSIIISEITHSSFSIIRKLFTHIRQFKPDVIHTHRQKENILGSLANLACIPFNGKLIPSVRTAHGAPEFNPKGKQKIQVWLDQFVGRYLQKRVIAVSEDLAKKLAAIYPVNHIDVIQNGVDVDALKALAETPADFNQDVPDKTHVGIIGRLEPVKRVDMFLDMAAILINQQPDKWHFHVVGDGKLKSELKEQSHRLGISKDMTFHGHRKDIPSCIAALDAIIMCSDHEGTPMTALEALTLGTPLIAHKVGGLQELLIHLPENLVTHHSAGEYAKTLLHLLKQKKTYSNNLSNQFFAKTNCEKVISLYKELLNTN